MAALRCWCSLVLKSWSCQSAAGEGDNDSSLEASNTNESKSDLVGNTKKNKETEIRQLQRGEKKLICFAGLIEQQ